MRTGKSSPRPSRGTFRPRASSSRVVSGAHLDAIGTRASEGPVAVTFRRRLREMLLLLSAGAPQLMEKMYNHLILIKWYQPKALDHRANNLELWFSSFIKGSIDTEPIYVQTTNRCFYQPKAAGSNDCGLHAIRYILHKNVTRAQLLTFLRAEGTITETECCNAGWLRCFRNDGLHLFGPPT